MATNQINVNDVIAYDAFELALKDIANNVLIIEKNFEAVKEVTKESAKYAKEMADALKMTGELKEQISLQNKLADANERTNHSLELERKFTDALNKANAENKRLIDAMAKAQKEYSKEALEDLKQRRDAAKKEADDRSEELKQKKEIAAENKKKAKEAKEAESAAKKARIEEEKSNEAANKAIGTINKLNKETAELTKRRNSLNLETKEGRKEFSKLNKQLTENIRKQKDFNEQIGRHQLNVGNYFDAVKKSFGIMTAAGAAFGVFSGGLELVISLVQRAWGNMKEFSKTVSNLKALTGLGGKALSDLASYAITAGKSFGIAGRDVVEAMKLIGGAKPELLKNAEALKYVTQQALILAKASGLELPEAATRLASALNQFDAPASKAAEVMDILANASLVGSAEIPDLTEAVQKFGSVAKTANISLSESAALVEVLAAKDLKGSEAGTPLLNIILKMENLSSATKSATIELEKSGVNIQFVMDKSKPFSERLTELSKLTKNGAGMMKLFGETNINAANILLNNISTFEQMSSEMGKQGTAAEQAAMNMDNLSGEIDYLVQSWDALLLSLDKGDGVMSKLFRNLIQSLTTAINFLGGTEGSLIDYVDKILNIWYGTNLNKDNSMAAKIKKDIDLLQSADLDMASKKLNEYRKTLVDLQKTEGNDDQIKMVEAFIKKAEAMSGTKWSYQLQEEWAALNKKTDGIEKKITDEQRENIQKRKEQREKDLKEQRDYIDELIAKNDLLIQSNNELFNKLTEEALAAEDLGMSKFDADLEFYDKILNGQKDLFNSEIEIRRQKGEDEEKLIVEQKKFEIEQAKDRMNFILSNAEMLSDEEISIMRNTITAMELELAKLSGVSEKTFFERIGLDEEGIARFGQGLSDVKDVLNEFLEFQNEAVQEQIDLRNKNIESIESELDTINQKADDMAASGDNFYSARKIQLENELKLEQEARDKALAQQSETQKKQIALQTAADLASQASSVASIISNTVKEWSSLGPFGVAGGILSATAGLATMFLTIKKARAQIQSLNVPKAKQGLFMDIKGGSHEQGGVDIYNKDGILVNTEGEESLAVFNRAATRGNKPLIRDFVNDINAGKASRYIKIDSLKMPQISQNSVDVSGVETRLDKTNKLLSKNETIINGRRVVKVGNNMTVYI